MPRSLSLALLGAIVLGLQAFGVPAALAQAPPLGMWHVSAAGTFVQPTFGMADRFGSLATGRVGVGRAAGARVTEARLERFAFRQGQVRLRAETQGPEIEVEQFDLALTLTGGSVHVQQRVREVGAVQPYVGGGIGLYYWQEQRAAYDDSFRTVPALDRPAQWSAGFHAGTGAALALTPQAALDLGVAYHVVLGELWPTINLGLENVSTFQFATVSAGVRYAF